MDIFDKCREFAKIVQQAKDNDYYPYFTPISSEPDRRVIIHGRELLMMGSNNYLGLTTHPQVKEAAIAAIRKYGSGCTGSRFGNGTLDIHVELEEKLAAFYNRAECVVFSTGYSANLGAISALVRRGDVAITDRLDHASIVDGCQMSYGTVKRFVHNDMHSLEHVLTTAHADAGKIIVVDGVFSVEGDLAPLDQMVPLAHKHGARLMVDEAHAVGVMGKNGRGTAEHFGVEDKVDLIMGTFSKTFASIGGYVVGDSEEMSFIRHQARTVLFSAAIPAAATATVIETLRLLQAEPERREHLWKNTRRMSSGLRAMGYNLGTSVTPIMPMHIGDDVRTMTFWRGLYDAGIFTNAFVPPGVPPGRSLIRTAVMATHTDADMDEALEKFEKVGRKCGIIA
ncbi:pyridoxal phosphate-dependent aminotransferase family protein [candidate division WOR-3 bacterium]|uniref:Pyridoxal phosphate-dependent aminotransferase family protein n=1 Tax=candidate division WOR-3 bacterium TaxID=2052148 RepID=A0A937XIX8_UNCW3|nr:pyridoxal phosphate-dependent aminotransferase family protein [candidate division WOR-3 bacterium]